MKVLQFSRFRAGFLIIRTMGSSHPWAHRPSVRLWRRGGCSGLALDRAGDACVGRVLGLDAHVRPDVMDGLGDRDRGLAEAGCDQFQLAVESGDVPACPDRVEVRLHDVVYPDRALLDLEAPISERPER